MMNTLFDKKVVVGFAVGMLLMSLSAAPKFELPTRIYAAPGHEVNVYYSNVFSSSVPSAYAFQTYSKKGRSYEERWCWTPSREDAGREVEIVLNAWNDDGLVASHTAVVEVAATPIDSKRRLTLAYFGASSTNSGYPQVLMDNMRTDGYESFRMVGTRCRNPSLGENAAWYDGYGGYTCQSFLTHYTVSEEEYVNVQDAAEREQLKALGVPTKVIHEWQKDLLRSPLVQFRNGQKVVDVAAWMDKVNGGVAPDLVIISLGMNAVFGLRGEIPDLRQHIRERVMPSYTQFVRTLRAAMPKVKFAVTTQCVGCGQDGFAANYGSGWNAVQNRKIVFALNAELAQFTREHEADGVVGLIPIDHAIDPVHSYHRVSVPAHAATKTKVMRFNNAVHYGDEGAKQIGGALSAWLQCRWNSL